MARTKGSKNKPKAETNDGELVIPPQSKEVIREVIKYVPEPRLEGFELYRALKNKGYYQGGSEGQWIEDPNGTERVYVPSPSELYTSFLGEPEKWLALRDAIIRAYIELQ